MLGLEAQSLRIGPLELSFAFAPRQARIDLPRPKKRNAVAAR